MHLQRLSLFGFRNYEQGEFFFEPQANAITGSNGSGKTNILDAIHYLCLCKSYFQTSDSANIRHGGNFFTISGEFKSGDATEEIVVSVKPGQRKSVKRNLKEYPRLSEHIGLLPLVMVAPVDQELITGGSEERRKLIDAIICQFNHSYLDDLVAFNRALQQRNAFLKQIGKGGLADESLLQVWNDQLVIYGNKVHATRKEFCEGFSPLFNSYYNKLTGNAEQVGIRYISQLNESSLEELLAISFHRDRVLQYTTSGVHRDDLELNLNDHPVKRIGSQGQQKSFVVALKLAQFEFMYRASGVKPLLLLDDIFDKLDKERITRLMELVSRETFGQLLITDTSQKHISEIFEAIHVPLHHIRCGS
jgi:DNA replication and repair protein RecF